MNERPLHPDRAGETWEVQRTRLQKQMEARELKAKKSPIPPLIVGLAVSTLALGLAMLAIVSKLDINGVEDIPPQLAVSSDAQEGAVQVILAEPGLRWSDLRLAGDCAPLLNGAPLQETPQAQVRAGDMLSCEDGQTLQIYSSGRQGNAIMHETKFGT